MPGKSSSTRDHILRLITVDAALASDKGAHLGELAEMHDVSTKAIQRDLTLLGDLAGEIVCVMEPADNVTGHTYRHRYVKGVRRLFSSTRD